MLNDPTWAAFATGCAVDANNNHFPSRRGVWYFEDCDVLVVYNNNPYANDPLDVRRTAELLLFTEYLAEEGIQILGLGYTADGYSYALVIDAPKFREQWVIDTWREILLASAK